MEKLFVLMIDLVKSKELDETSRYDVQTRMHLALEFINKHCKNKLVKSLSFSAGDSIQGLFSDVTTAYSTYLFIKYAVFPYTIRAGIGYGKVNVEMLVKFKSDNSNLYDGKAYHAAKEAIDLAKKLDYEMVVHSENAFDHTVNHLINDGLFISLTESRGALLSLLNLIEPVYFNALTKQVNYYKDTLVFVEEIVKFYHERSRVSSDQKALFNKTLYKKLTQSIEPVDYDLTNHESTISSEAREILVSLTSSTPQNIGAIIRGSNMDFIRKRLMARISLLQYFYGSE
ncbi:SatD family protein [Liberiplasma polymorphum]|uniref:SatD family protein n=1 Tax=Liberiplasma polymorphum TaxID=3374570 RepID=UPI0037715BA5